MMKVFICSPYRGDVEQNVKNARFYAHLAAICGYCPIAPHLFFPQFLDDNNPEERIMGITLGVEQMKFCDEIWVYGDHVSNGMEYELAAAKKLRIPVRLYDGKANRIFPDTMTIDDRVSDEIRRAVSDMKFA